MPKLGLILMFAAAARGTALGADAPKGATVAEAAKVLDLRAYPLAEGAEEPRQRSMASLSYMAPGTVKGLFESQRKQLLGLKWKEMPNAYVSEQSANGTFTREGFTISLTVFPGSKAGEVNVSIMNHGNVEAAKLPFPPNVKPLYSGPVSIGYTTEAPAEQTAAACRDLLLAQGWEPYGSAGDVQFYKQNAVRLTARVAAAPAQGGKTIIDYSTVLMSADLPAPAETEQLQYADHPTQLFFDTKATLEEVVRFYGDVLAKRGFKATTEKPIRVGFRDELIYRNPQKDMLTLQLTEVDGKRRILLRHYTAAEVEEQDRRAKAAIDRKNAEKNKPLAKYAVALPAGASGVKADKAQIEFKVGSGKAKAAVDAWRKQFAKDGWKEQVDALEDMAGSLSFRKDNQELDVTFVDPGFIPGEITLRARGVELERADEKKDKEKGN